MAQRIKLRRDVAANWESVNPVLAEGEIGLVTDGDREWKIGDNFTPWTNLAKRLGYFPVRVGEVGVVDPTYPYVDVRRYGVTAGGSVDQGVKLNNCLTSLLAMGLGWALFSGGTYRITTGAQVNGPSVTFIGQGAARTILDWRGVGELIQLDEDDGGAYDAGSYNGVGSRFTLIDMQLTCGSAATPLANGLGNYLAGSYGIRDWRGGGVKTIRSYLSKFEYSFWGIQSDIDFFQDTTVAFNKTAFWLGPRSDQSEFDHIWSFGNDTVFSFNGVSDALVKHWQTDTDGSATTYPVEVKEWTASNRVCSNIVFEEPWLEATSSFGDANPGFDVPAFFGINLNDPSVNGGVTIRDPVILVNNYSDVTKRHVLFLADLDNCAVLECTGVSGYQRSAIPWTNLRAVFRFNNGSAANTTRIRFSEKDLIVGARLAENYHPSGAFIQTVTQGFNGKYLVNIAGGTQGVSIGYLGLMRSLQHDNTVPTAGTGGDISLLRAWLAGKDLGWVWSGSAAHPIHVPTASPNRGDASVTLVPGTDHEEQPFRSTLTANRTVTLSTTGALNGHRFRVTRNAVTPGNFTLDIGGLKTIPANTNGKVEVIYDGSAWQLADFVTW